MKFENFNFTSAVSGQMQILPILGVVELGLLLKKTPAGILTDRCRAPHLIPPSCEPPGSKQPLWILEDVIAWLRTHQRPTTSAPPLPPPPSRRGRPTKREQLMRQRAKAASQGVQDES